MTTKTYTPPARDRRALRSDDWELLGPHGEQLHFTKCYTYLGDALQCLGLAADACAGARDVQLGEEIASLMVSVARLRRSHRRDEAERRDGGTMLADMLRHAGVDDG